MQGDAPMSDLSPNEPTNTAASTLTKGERNVEAGLQKKAPPWIWNVVAYAELFAAAPAVAVGALALAGRGPRVIRRHPVAFGLVGLGGVALLAKWQLDRFLVEKPRYDIEPAVNGLEIRRYEPRVVAETKVEGGDWDAALEEGFRRLAGFIFGGNTRRESLAMTAPVNVANVAKDDAERLPMTAPVTMSDAGGGYVVTFTMPREHGIADLPVPNDPRVVVRETGPRRVAVLRFRGRYTADRVRAKLGELSTRVAEAGLRPMGPSEFAGYDSPSTLPFLRRNEVWVEVG